MIFRLLAGISTSRVEPSIHPTAHGEVDSSTVFQVVARFGLDGLNRAGSLILKMPFGQHGIRIHSALLLRRTLRTPAVASMMALLLKYQHAL